MTVWYKVRSFLSPRSSRYFRCLHNITFGCLSLANQYCRISVDVQHCLCSRGSIGIWLCSNIKHAPALFIIHSFSTQVRSHQSTSDFLQIFLFSKLVPEFSHYL